MVEPTNHKNLNLNEILSGIPEGLRKPLLDEYSSIVNNYTEHRWGSSELSAGKFCEIVYTLLEGFATSTYPSIASKPANFVQSCRNLENKIVSPRSFQILIPRMLPALYEIRNNRGVGHIGGDVDPNEMDATAVLHMTTWIMAELVRVYHELTTVEAQRSVNILVEHRIPLVWQSGTIRRVLQADIPLKDQVLILLLSSTSPVQKDALLRWIEPKDTSYFNRILRDLHHARYLELADDGSKVTILPPGSAYATSRVQALL